MKTIEKEGLTLTTILTTHHHADHAGGNNRMLALMKAEKGQIKVVGGDKSLQGLNHEVKDNEQLQVKRSDVRKRWKTSVDSDWKSSCHLFIDALPYGRSCVLSSRW